MFDLVIENGSVVDGTGAEAVQTNLGVDGDRIAEVGLPPGAEAKDRLDASGLVVAPGFIDTHNHAHSEQRGGILRIPEADNMLRQGVTTIIAGHCGGSAHPIGEHLKEVEERRFHSNYATLVGYGMVKANARGGNTGGHPTDDESAEIERLLRQAMEEGAFGMTTGPLGKPQSFFSTDEFVRASRIVAEYGGVYDSHIRDEGEWGKHLDAIQEVVTIAREAGISAQISHLKLWGKLAWPDRDKVLEILDDANRAGLRLTADQYPYTGGYRGLWGLVATAEYTRDQLLGDRKDVALACISDQLDKLGGADRILLCPDDADPELNGKTVQIVANMAGKAPADCAWELLQRKGLSACWMAMREPHVVAFMKSPHVMVGTDAHLRDLDDTAHCHPRNFGAYPRVLGHYVRKRRVLDLPLAVKKMTSMPADKYGIQDRGLIARGKYADLVVFDPATVIDQATWAKPHQYPVGIEHVLVNGRFAVRSGTTTDERPGRVLRRGG